MDRLLKYAKTAGKHGLYQTLPPELLRCRPELKTASFSRRLDSRRYDWFSSRVDFRNKRVVDIGANIGYFSFRLVSEFGATVTAYEPFPAHHETIQLIKSQLSIGDEQMLAINNGVTYESLADFPDADVVLLFNVLHHAGSDFDSSYVRKIDDWHGYAEKYLVQLLSKTEILIFQMGCSWGGNAGQLCDIKNAPYFVRELLLRSGWDVLHVGTVSNLFFPEYRDYPLKNIKKDENPLASGFHKVMAKTMRRTGLMRYDAGFMLRPIFICKRA